MTTGRSPPGDKETWWWNDKVQEVIKAKKEGNRIHGKHHQAVSTANELAMNELYEELETPEGERNIFRIAKARDKATKDFTHVKHTKNAHGVILKGRPGYDHRKMEGVFCLMKIIPDPSLTMEFRLRV